MHVQTKRREHQTPGQAKVLLCYSVQDLSDADEGCSAGEENNMKQDEMSKWQVSAGVSASLSTFKTFSADKTAKVIQIISQFLKMGLVGNKLEFILRLIQSVLSRFLPPVN
ncbi:Hypothetical predicted protein [Scomber scombrus]|uniref:Uncharacterized protein n=1 Tax=Scomber scombrus TaxID=13677 RepID=A0AAV1PCL6_SCOSC